jgi:small-conductance mechanosensitive channel
LVMSGMVLMIAVGCLAEWAFLRWSQPIRLRFEQAAPQRFCGRVGFLSLRIVFDLVAVSVFAIAAIATFFVFYQGHEPSRLLVTTCFTAVLIVRATSIVSRFLIAPSASHLRIIAFNDADAQYYHRCVLWFVGVAAFGSLTFSLMQLLGLSEDLHLLMRLIVGVLLAVALCLMIWHGRAGVANLIRTSQNDGAGDNRMTAYFAETWHYLAIAYVICIAGLAFVRLLAGEVAGAAVSLGSLLIVVAVPLIDAAIGRLLDDFIASRRDADDPVQDTTYIPAVRQGMRILLVLLGIVVLVRLWGVDLFSMADQGLGATLTRTILDVGFTMLIAYVGWQISKTAIDRHMAAGEGEGLVERGSEGGGTGASRIRTLLPLLRRCLQILIVVMVVMIVLSSLGVDIGPLIAGAGIFGLAIGFGAQTLVRDIVSGIFFLLDDAFRVGEYVDIGDVKGTVERITVRSLVLRHQLGPLHTVPFGEIKYLSNYSRDWVIMKLAFRVTYDTDIKKVKKIFKQIGAELMEDEVLGPGFLEPFKSQGVKSMEDSAIIVHGKFMAKPGEQFMIRKEVYSRVQEAFKDAGIQFAHRRVTVYLPLGVEPGNDQAKAIRDAAAAAILEDENSLA